MKCVKSLDCRSHLPAKGGALYEKNYNFGIQILFASLFNMTEAELQTFLAPQQDGQSNLPPQEESQLQRHLIGKQIRQRYSADLKKKYLNNLKLLANLILQNFTRLTGVK